MGEKIGKTFEQKVFLFILIYSESYIFALANSGLLHHSSSESVITDHLVRCLVHFHHSTCNGTTGSSVTGKLELHCI